jgi:2-keto-4-pentenoate hydratase/2-oxohepta-3-ene-1,7-dioic acid hydratase in catechol pathway
MKIVRFSSKERPEGIGILLDNSVFNFTEAYQACQLLTIGECSCPVCDPAALMDLGLFNVEVFESVLNFAQEHNMLERFLVEEYRLLSPVKNPSKILALGRNYVAHAKELGHPIPSEPVFFCKLSSSVVGPDDPVIYWKGLTRVDHEVELAIVIGKRGFRIPEGEALSYVAGYTIVNDVTARDMQTEDLKTASPWTRSKGFDTFCPIGPWIVLPEEVGDPGNLELEMRVNGEVRQKDNTRSMLFDIPTIISYLSRHCTLMPGDVISTGTPEGIGPVYPGDIMECVIEKIGVLKNPVVAEE